MFVFVQVALILAKPNPPEYGEGLYQSELETEDQYNKLNENAILTYF